MKRAEKRPPGAVTPGGRFRDLRPRTIAGLLYHNSAGTQAPIRDRKGGAAAMTWFLVTAGAWYLTKGLFGLIDWIEDIGGKSQ